ncbi:hypothetical protein Ancab_010405 [Ancistrocladus abbreviatus]
MALALLFIIFLFPTLSSAAGNIYNVVSFGARSDGRTDPSAALLKAWNAACATARKSTIYIPAGRPVVFSGNYGKSRGITVRLLGNLVAPSDYRAIGNSAIWLSFEFISGVTFSGGTLDGQGGGLWACKRSGEGGCPGGATHIVINGCDDVKIQGVTVNASGASPNTDGIYVQLSTGVTIYKANIATRDDCISIGVGTSNLWIEKISCGPSHGISIGSLGKDLNELGVHNVTVTTATFTGRKWSEN